MIMPNTVINYWSEVEGGFRSSFMLRSGALILALGAILNLAASVLGGAGNPLESLSNAAWLLFIVALWALAGGFVWVASYPFLTRFGFVTGAFHLAHGLYLLVLFFNVNLTPIPPVSVTVGRLLATILFALVEKDWLNRTTRSWLIVAAGLQLLKILARILGLWPDLGPVLDQALDAGILVGLAAAYLNLGGAIKRRENIWAKRTYESRQANFADFNNPEHSWNKVEIRRNRKQAPPR